MIIVRGAINYGTSSSDIASKKTVAKVKKKWVRGRIVYEHTPSITQEGILMPAPGEVYTLSLNGLTPDYNFQEFGIKSPDAFEKISDRFYASGIVQHGDITNSGTYAYKLIEVKGTPIEAMKIPRSNKTAQRAKKRLLANYGDLDIFAHYSKSREGWFWHFGLTGEYVDIAANGKKKGADAIIDLLKMLKGMRYLGLTHLEAVLTPRYRLKDGVNLIKPESLYATAEEIAESNERHKADLKKFQEEEDKKLSPEVIKARDELYKSMGF